jgi:hypothetical protein
MRRLLFAERVMIAPCGGGGKPLARHGDVKKTSEMAGKSITKSLNAPR